MYTYTRINVYIITQILGYNFQTIFFSFTCYNDLMDSVNTIIIFQKRILNLKCFNKLDDLKKNKKI